MPFNGSGVFVRLENWSSDAASNLPISATKFDIEDNDFAGGFDLCLTRDGQGAPSGPLTWAQQLTLTRGSDGQILGLSRTGGANNPGLQFNVADVGGFTLNTSIATGIALAIAGVAALSIGSGRNITIGAPPSGISLQVNAAPGNSGVSVGLTTDTSNSLGINCKGAAGSATLVLNSAGTEALTFINNQSGGTLVGVPTGALGLGTVNNQPFYFGNARLIIQAPPGGGIALTANAAAGQPAAVLNGVSGFNVLNVNQVSGQGAVIGFSGNGGTQSWDLGGALSATHFQVYDVTGAIQILDLTPVTGLATFRGSISSGLTSDASNSIGVNCTSNGKASLVANASGTEALSFICNQSGAATSGVPTGAVGAFVVAGQPFYFGNMRVVIAGPPSGSALTIQGAGAGTNAVAITNAGTSGISISGPGTGIIITPSSSGSGVSLVNGGAAANAFLFGSNYTSTGTAVPVLTANKPGAGTAIAAWLNVAFSSTQGWIPIWSN